MHTYIVRRRRGQPFEITAQVYTEDKRAKRVYFHKLADKSDRDCFCFLSEIAAIGANREPSFEFSSVCLPSTLWIRGELHRARGR